MPCYLQCSDLSWTSQVLDGGILLLALILNPLARRRRKRLAAESTAVPDVEAPGSAAPLSYDSGLDARDKPEEKNCNLEDKKEEVGIETKDA